MPVSIPRTLLPLLVTAALLVFGARAVAAQDAVTMDVVPPPNPMSPRAVTQTSFSDGTYASIHYGSPRKRDREIFGGLVPFGEVWRLGANEATEMTVTQDVRLGDMDLAAGTYALLVIPNEEAWTLIVNAGLGMWGAFSYSDEHDVLRLETPTSMTESIHEAFTISLEANEEGSAATLSMMWDQTSVSIPVTPAE